MEREQTQSAVGVEFTYSWYQEFLDRIDDAGYEFRQFSDDVGEGDVVLRHDVDLSLKDALRMALMEADKGIQATYCVLLTSPLYNPLEREQREQIRDIASLGHDIALHFSTHEYWDVDEEPDDEALANAVEMERAALGNLRFDDVDTVSFHAPPPWVLDRELEDIRNAYAPAYFDEITYVADSGQRWRESPPAVEEFGESAQVLVHPGLWSDSDESFDACIESAVTDACRHANAKAQREFLEGAS